MKGSNSETSLESKKPNDVGTHFVRLELLNLNMYFIPGFIERRAEFRARKWNLKQKWHFLRLNSLEMKKIIDVGCHSVRLELLNLNMYFIPGFIERRAEFRARKWNLKQRSTKRSTSKWRCMMGRGLSVLCSQAGCVHSVNAHAIRHIRACLYIRHKVLMPICGRVLPDLSSLWINSRRSGLRLQLTLGPSPYPLSAACG